MRPLILAVFALLGTSAAHAQPLRFLLLSDCLAPPLVVPAGSVVRASTPLAPAPPVPLVSEPVPVVLVAVPAGRAGEAPAFAEARRTAGTLTQIHAACMRGALAVPEDEPASARQGGSSRGAGASSPAQRTAAGPPVAIRHYIRERGGVCYYTNARGGREYVDPWLCK